MLRVHTADGRTVSVDLRDEEQARLFLTQLRDQGYQEQIRAMTVLQYADARCKECEGAVRWKGIQHTVARPEGFVQVYFHVEDVKPDLENRIKGGERVVCFADDVRLSTMAHRENPAVRFSLRKMGKHRYNPLAEP